MNKPLVYDVFSGAGGAARGYQQAGFYVIGIDNVKQPRYVGDEFYQMDAFDFLWQLANGLWPEPTLVHTSPPCQRYSVASKSWNGKSSSHPDLIGYTRKLLQEINKPYVIENVVGSPLINPLLLCGSMFPELRVIRHRLFECNPIIFFPPATCCHQLCFTKDKRKAHYGKLDEMTAFVQVNGGGNCSKNAASDAMGIWWMSKSELNNAIPPAYTEFIGKQMMKLLEIDNDSVERSA